MSEKGTLVIDQSDLLAKLQEIKSQSDGDLAHVIELLLLENYMLVRGQSAGLCRGVATNFSDYPRFLQIEEASHSDEEDE